MPLPSIIQTTDSFNTWFDATNNLISHVANTSVYLQVAQNATPSVSTGNVSLNGTATIVNLTTSNVLSVNGNTTINGIATFNANVAITGDVTMSNSLSVTRNLVLSANITGALNITATQNVNTTALNTTTISATGNVATGNVIATGFITASGTITASGNVTATAGNMNAVNIYATSNVSAGAAGFLTGNGINITTVNASNISNGTLPAARIAAGSLSHDKLATTSAGRLLLGNATGGIEALAMSGDVTISGTGATTIGAGKVTSSMIADGTIVNGDVSASAAIAYSKLSLTGGIVNADISGSAAIAVSKLAASTISGVTLGSNLNAVTFNNGGSGAASGTTYNGSGAITVSYNTVGAPSTGGTGASGTWGINITGSAGSATTATTATSATTAAQATQVSNAIIFNNGGAGEASGTSYNGSAGKTISYNTVGAPSTGGAGASGTWGINITGSAGSASSATTATVAYEGVSTGFVLRRGDTSIEGGEIRWERASDQAHAWVIDVYGTGAAPVLRAYANPGVGGSGGVQLVNGATEWSAMSDERTKILTEPISNATSRLQTLRTVMGRFTSDDADVTRSFLIAQDVERVFPELVHTIESEDLNDAKVMAYQGLVPYLVAAIKELSAEVAALRATLQP